MPFLTSEAPRLPAPPSTSDLVQLIDTEGNPVYDLDGNPIYVKSQD